VADLLGLDVEQLSEMLVSTVTAMRGERLRKNFDVEAAEENRDATAKARIVLNCCCANWRDRSSHTYWINPPFSL
jgi:hypothetical protein